MGAGAKWNAALPARIILDFRFLAHFTPIHQSYFPLSLDVPPSRHINLILIILQMCKKVHDRDFNSSLVTFLQGLQLHPQHCTYVHNNAGIIFGTITIAFGISFRVFLSRTNTPYKSFPHSGQIVGQKHSTPITVCTKNLYYSFENTRKTSSF